MKVHKKDEDASKTNFPPSTNTLLGALSPVKFTCQKVDIQREEGGDLLAHSSFPSLLRYHHSGDGLGSLRTENIPKNANQALQGVQYAGKESSQWKGTVF